jgi:galactitol-specific phosphotransferase system IIB component
MPLPMKLRTFKKISAGLVIVFLLSACGSTGSGVSIGKTEVSSAQIQKYVDEILTERAKVDTTQMNLDSGASLVRTQAQFQIISVVLDQIISEKKITVTAADVAARRAEIITQIGSEADLPKALVSASLAPSNLDKYLKIILISEKLNTLVVSEGATAETAGEAVTKLVTDTAKKLGVKVNSRYGKWNEATATIEEADNTGGAVTPVP